MTVRLARRFGGLAAPRAARPPFGRPGRAKRGRRQARVAASRVGVGQRGQRHGLAQQSVEPGDPIAHRAPRRHRLLLREKRVEPGEARQAVAARAARGRARGRARATAPCSSSSPPTSGCLSSASKGTGASSSAAAAAMPSSKVPRRELRQGLAGAVVSLDAPAPKQRRHAPGKLADRA